MVSAGIIGLFLGAVRSRPSSLEQKIVIHHQLTNLGVQLLFFPLGLTRPPGKNRALTLLEVKSGFG